MKDVGKLPGRYRVIYGGVGVVLETRSKTEGTMSVNRCHHVEVVRFHDPQFRVGLRWGGEVPYQDSFVVFRSRFSSSSRGSRQSLVEGCRGKKISE